MATPTLTEPLEVTNLAAGERARPALATARTPAATAAARLSRVNLTIGGLGLLTALFLVTRLVESWRIDPRSHRNTISFLGQRLSYPTANVGAIAVLALAAIGLAVSITALAATVREPRARATADKSAHRPAPAMPLPDGSDRDRRLEASRLLRRSAAPARLHHDGRNRGAGSGRAGRGARPRAPPRPTGATRFGSLPVGS